ncbi:MAG: thermonuclease family protein [Candidatus Tectimicrobiota bacterium]
MDQPYNDGDSFHVQCGAHTFVARLYFVDAPEATLRYPDRTREQSEYFGVTLDETLRAGRQATAVVRQLLRQPFVLWTREASAGGRTRVPRYYSFVEVASQDLAALLVGQGLARTKGVIATGPHGIPARQVRQKLWALERQAQQQQRGIWATSTATPLAQHVP